MVLAFELAGIQPPAARRPRQRDGRRPRTAWCAAGRPSCDDVLEPAGVRRRAAGRLAAWCRGGSDQSGVETRPRSRHALTLTTPGARRWRPSRARRADADAAPRRARSFPRIGRRSAGADPTSDAVFVFSSGTTGMPKAVRHTFGAFAAAVGHWRDALGLTVADRLQIVTPPSHILGSAQHRHRARHRWLAAAAPPLRRRLPVGPHRIRPHHRRNGRRAHRFGDRLASRTSSVTTSRRCGTSCGARRR